MFYDTIMPDHMQGQKKNSSPDQSQILVEKQGYKYLRTLFDKKLWNQIIFLC